MKTPRLDFCGYCSVCALFFLLLFMPLSLSLLLALYCFIFIFIFMVIVVTSVGAWLKRKHTKTRLRREKFVGLCFCVSVYDLTHVFMGLIFWVWEIGTYVFYFFFFDKVYLVFLWRRKERKRMKKKKKMAVGVSLWRRKKERKRKKKKNVCLVWLCIDSGSHICGFNYENAMEIEFWKLKTPKYVFSFHNSSLKN